MFGGLKEEEFTRCVLGVLGLRCGSLFGGSRVVASRFRSNSTKLFGSYAAASHLLS